MPPLVLTMAGGAIGAGVRYIASTGALRAFGIQFPWGTLGINIIGGFFMGVLVATLSRFGDNGEPWRLFLGVGVLGGFTTFSAFSLETWAMIERGQAIPAIGYIAASVIGSVAALALGLTLVRTL
ncbi:fluoride efflux transporter CrcB [Sphingomonas paeninsulae]|uniref:Fluoride-specific ion channel FluC n=1 Tax=Sphingomonas paeninsulae TaxID=2319844 RepID=A0A494TA75_SPHPE|nr:fluoride efflux transporter CrcB [Sphingomonas paeninsulae]AYJ86339.1 fluoride efflux transporter CrcB [Sphingomonas paeninsulae]